MAYFTDLFSPETFANFLQSDRTISGFRLRQKNMAERVQTGDIFVCYLTRVSRWCGLLEVVEGPFQDKTPLFVDGGEDPYEIRFRVRLIVWLPPNQAIPIHDSRLWDALTFTKGVSKSSTSWTGKLRASLVKLETRDGALLVKLLKQQSRAPEEIPLDDRDQRRLSTQTVRGVEKDVQVFVPEDTDETEVARAVGGVEHLEERESIRVQALLAQIGLRMGLRAWIPRSDKSRVLKEIADADARLLDRLPLNYDDITLRTIEQIDVIWLKGRSIVRAFEVEHTTAVYSGILRMADLLALQPNMDIRLHIVAPSTKREKVMQELRRPVFSLLDRGPLADSCTYLSYESVRELANNKHLAHLSDSVLDEFAEEVDL